jgi:hypothetical protein
MEGLFMHFTLLRFLLRRKQFLLDLAL